MRRNWNPENHSARLGRSDFLELLIIFQQMREGEWKRFAADPQNAALLREYDRYARGLRLFFLLPLSGIFVVSIAAAVLLGQ